jgi:hypothetical protein
METLAELPVQQVRVRLARAMQVVMRLPVFMVAEAEVPVLLGQRLERYPVVAAMDSRQVLLEHLQLTLEAEVVVVIQALALLAAMVEAVMVVVVPLVPVKMALTA